jgi:hypothetical protein
VKAVQEFRIAEPSGERLSDSLARALSEGNATKPPSWEAYVPYGRNEEMRQVVQGTSQSLRDTNNFGVSIYQVK